LTLSHGRNLALVNPTGLHVTVIGAWLFIRAIALLHRLGDFNPTDGSAGSHDGCNYKGPEVEVRWP
jgi:hypothetical protein